MKTIFITLFAFTPSFVFFLSINPLSFWNKVYIDRYMATLLNQWLPLFFLFSTTLTSGVPSRWSRRNLARRFTIHRNHLQHYSHCYQQQARPVLLSQRLGEYQIRQQQRNAFPSRCYLHTKRFKCELRMHTMCMCSRQDWRLTKAVVAAPKRAMRDRTETWPMNVAIASNTSTPYTYGCCQRRYDFKNTSIN